MKTSIAREVSELLSRGKDERSRAKLDVLRVLVVNRGTSWRSELIQDLRLLYDFKGEPEEVDEGALDRALDELHRGGLLRVEERVRGMLAAGKSERDKLISLTDYAKIRDAMSSDRILTLYMCSRVSGV